MNEQRPIPGTGLVLAVLAVVLTCVGWTAWNRPVRLTDSAPPIGNSPVPLPEFRLDINRATAAELALLPAIGPALAQRIVEDRAKNGPFNMVDDLDRVPGIGKAAIERLRQFATAQAGPAEP